MNDVIPAHLEATRFLDIAHPRIVAAAAELKAGARDRIETAVRLFYFVRDEIAYNPYGPFTDPEDYVTSAVLARGTGFCVQKAALLAALARAAGLPARLGFADIRSHVVPEKLREMMGTDVFTYHGFASLFLDGRWVKATPAFDRVMCAKQGFATVEFDGRADALLPARTLAGGPHVEYLVDRGYREDVPYDEIIAAFRRLYAPHA